MSRQNSVLSLAFAFALKPYYLCYALPYFILGEVVVVHLNPTMNLYIL